MDDSARLSALKLHYRRRFSTDLAALRSLAEAAAAAMTASPLTMTTLSFEGGSGTGTITCEPALTLQVCEELLLELDTTVPSEPSGAVILDWSQNAAKV